MLGWIQNLENASAIKFKITLIRFIRFNPLKYK